MWTKMKMTIIIFKILYEMYHIMGVFTIEVPKRYDLFLKDYKGQLWIFGYHTLL
jgi:hypothetical protein